MKPHRHSLSDAIMLVALLFLLMVTSAHAYTMCGAPAVGFRPDKTKWPDSGPARGAPGQFVNDQGFWQYCPSWVKPDGGDPMTPQPQLDCIGREGSETWYSEDGKSECNSQPKDWTDSPYTKIHYGVHGARQVIFDDLGPTRGRQVWQCGLRDPGQWYLVNQNCETIKQPTAPAPRKLSPTITRPG